MVLIVPMLRTTIMTFDESKLLNNQLAILSLYPYRRDNL